MNMAVEVGQISPEAVPVDTDIDMTSASTSARLVLSIFDNLASGGTVQPTPSMIDIV